MIPFLSDMKLQKRIDTRCLSILGEVASHREWIKKFEEIARRERERREEKARAKAESRQGSAMFQLAQKYYRKDR